MLPALAAAHPDGADVPTLAQADWFLGLVGLVRVGVTGDPGTVDAIRRRDSRSVVSETGPRWTTAALLAAQASVLQAVWQRRSTGPGVARREALAWAGEALPALASEQRAMVERLCASGAGVEVVVGG